MEDVVLKISRNRINLGKGHILSFPQFLEVSTHADKKRS